MSYAVYFVTNAHCHHNLGDKAFADLRPNGTMTERQANMVYELYTLGFARCYGGRGYYGEDVTGVDLPYLDQMPISSAAFRLLVTKHGATIVADE